MTQTTQTLPAPLPPVLTAAQQTHVVNVLRRAARAEVLPRFRNLAPADIDTKSGPHDLVTAADLAAEAMITRALAAAAFDTAATHASAFAIGRDASSSLFSAFL